MNVVDKMSVHSIDFTQRIILVAMKVPDGLLIVSMIAELKSTWALLSWSAKALLTDSN